MDLSAFLSLPAAAAATMAWPDGLPSTGAVATVVCPVAGCGFVGATAASLRGHGRAHSHGEKPFTCDVMGCSYAAATPALLKKHQRVHSGDRPFKCTHDGCAYGALQRSDLQKHERIHTGEKPFRCDQPGCSYAATQQSHVYAHSKTHSRKEVLTSTAAGGSGGSAGAPGELLGGFSEAAARAVVAHLDKGHFASAGAGTV